MKNLFFFVFFCSFPLWASPIGSIENCAKDNFDKALCEVQLAKLVFFQKIPEFKAYVEKEGLGQIAENKELFGNIGFYGSVEALGIIVAHPEYPSALKDRALLFDELKPVFDNYTDRLLAMMEMVYLNPDSSKSLQWFENKDWPYPLFSTLKGSTKPAAKRLMAYFDGIDKLKKDPCLLDSKSKLAELRAQYRDFDIYLASTKIDFSSCSMSAERLELLKYLAGLSILMIKKSRSHLANSKLFQRI